MLKHWKPLMGKFIGEISMELWCKALKTLHTLSIWFVHITILSNVNLFNDFPGPKHAAWVGCNQSPADHASTFLFTLV